jgi:hypothetical protein
MTPEMLRLIDDPGLYAAQFLKIVDKNGQLIPMTSNINQDELDQVVLTLTLQNMPIRIIVLKGRQVTASTWTASRIFRIASTQFYVNAMVIAHDQRSTGNIFNMHKRFYSFLPPEIRPMQKISNRQEIIFANPSSRNASETGENGLMSQIKVETAGKGTAGRSGTLSHLHCSEFSFWNDASTVKASLFESIPDLPGTWNVIESTANGIGGKGQEFYKMWRSAVNGKSTFTPVFLPWFRQQEYELTIRKPFDPDDCTDQYGVESVYYHKLVPKYGHDSAMRKLAWRRNKIDTISDGLISPLDLFKQEYPFEPEEAFLSSGRPVFNNEAIMTAITGLEGIGSFKCVLGDDGTPIENNRGNWRIYARPNANKRYVLGADVAEGLERGDYSAAYILDEDGVQVASYYGHIPPDAFGGELVKACKRYNTALAAPEINNHGHTVFAAMKNLGYNNFYVREQLDKRGRHLTPQLCWQTNSKTKRIMIDGLCKEFRDNGVVINDRNLLTEMSELTLDSDGGITLGGRDRVVAMAIAIQALKQIPQGKLGLITKEEPSRDEQVVPFQKRLIELKKKRDNESYFEFGG